jgi:hypothetical protein
MGSRFTIAVRATRALVTGVAVLAMGSALAPATAAAAPASESAATSAAAVVWKSRLYEFRTPGNKGWFYTANMTEYNRAKGAGFAPTGRYTGYVANRVVAGSVPVYRARLKARSAYLLTLSLTELRRLVASGQWVYEGVVGRTSKYAGSNKFKLYRLSKAGQGWRTADLALARSLQAAGWHLDGSLGYIWRTVN